MKFDLTERTCYKICWNEQACNDICENAENRNKVQNKIDELISDIKWKNNWVLDINIINDSDFFNSLLDELFHLVGKHEHHIPPIFYELLNNNSFFRSFVNNYIKTSIDSLFNKNNIEILETISFCIFLETDFKIYDIKTEINLSTWSEDCSLCKVFEEKLNYFESKISAWEDNSSDINDKLTDEIFDFFNTFSSFLRYSENFLAKNNVEHFSNFICKYIEELIIKFKKLWVWKESLWKLKFIQWRFLLNYSYQWYIESKNNSIDDILEQIIDKIKNLLKWFELMNNHNIWIDKNLIKDVFIANTMYVISFLPQKINDKIDIECSSAIENIDNFDNPKITENDKKVLIKSKINELLSSQISPEKLDTFINYFTMIVNSWLWLKFDIDDSNNLFEKLNWIENMILNVYITIYSNLVWEQIKDFKWLVNNFINIDNLDNIDEKKFLNIVELLQLMINSTIKLEKSDLLVLWNFLLNSSSNYLKKLDNNKYRLVWTIIKKFAKLDYNRYDRSNMLNEQKLELSEFTLIWDLDIELEKNKIAAKYLSVYTRIHLDIAYFWSVYAKLHNIKDNKKDFSKLVNLSKKYISEFLNISWDCQYNEEYSDDYNSILKNIWFNHLRWIKDISFKSTKSTNWTFVNWEFYNEEFLFQQWLSEVTNHYENYITSIQKDFSDWLIWINALIWNWDNYEEKVLSNLQNLIQDKLFNSIAIVKLVSINDYENNLKLDSSIHYQYTIKYLLDKKYVLIFKYPTQNKENFNKLYSNFDWKSNKKVWKIRIINNIEYSLKLLFDYEYKTTDIESWLKNEVQMSINLNDLENKKIEHWFFKIKLNHYLEAWNNPDLKKKLILAYIDILKILLNDIKHNIYRASNDELGIIFYYDENIIQEQAEIMSIFDKLVEKKLSYFLADWTLFKINKQHTFSIWWVLSSFWNSLENANNWLEIWIQNKIVWYYSDNEKVNSLEKAEVLKNIQECFLNDKFIPHFQPIFDIKLLLEFINKKLLDDSNYKFSYDKDNIELVNMIKWFELLTRPDINSNKPVNIEEYVKVIKKHWFEEDFAELNLNQWAKVINDYSIIQTNDLFISVNLFISNFTSKHILNKLNSNSEIIRKHNKLELLEDTEKLDSNWILNISELKNNWYKTAIDDYWSAWSTWMRITELKRKGLLHTVKIDLLLITLECVI